MQKIIETLQNLGPLKWIHEQLLPFILQITEFTAQIPAIWQFFATALWSAIPFIESDVGVAIAIAAGVPTVPATIAAIIGNWVAVMAVISLTHKGREALRGKKADEEPTSKRQKKVMRAVQKYGVPGASLLGPMLIGTHLNSFFMAAAGVDKKYLMFWQTIAIIVWGIIFAVILHIAMSAGRGQALFW